ncbi:hypothetical protein [Salana multivorans]|nr:hypothetical protein [Salana multivorans]
MRVRATVRELAAPEPERCDPMVLLGRIRRGEAGPLRVNGRAP